MDVLKVERKQRPGDGAEGQRTNDLPREQRQQADVACAYALGPARQLHGEREDEDEREVGHHDDCQR